MPPFSLNEQNQHNRRHDDVQGEERADAIHEQIVNEERHIQSVMLDDPRNKLRIREKQSNQTEGEIEMPKFHWVHSFQETRNRVELISPSLITAELMISGTSYARENRRRLKQIEGEHKKLPRIAISNFRRCCTIDRGFIIGFAHLDLCRLFQISIQYL